MTQKAIIAGLDSQFLQITTANSDRFVFVNYFQPLLRTEYWEIPGYDPSWKETIPLLATRHGPSVMRELVERLNLGHGIEDSGIPWPPPEADNFGRVTIEPNGGSREMELLRRELGGLSEFASALHLSSDLGSVATELSTRVDRIASTAHALTSASEATASVYPTLPKKESDYLEKWLGTATTKRTLSAEQLFAMLQSQIGVLFLDRTRVRPIGFAVGEHLYSLSLAPGEEVVLEQKTFSKRETTFEEQSEEERQLDIELSSTLTTEIQEGLDRQDSRTNTTGWTGGGGVEGEIKGVPVKASGSYSNTVVDAHSASRRRSVKDGTTSSSKVASKYRAVHRTTFRLAKEDRFESTSKRVIKNPSRYTPMQLHYFRIIQRLELQRERYGARLSWAPSVKDPAFDIFRRIADGKKKIKQAELARITITARPEPPKKTAQPAQVSKGTAKDADKWGLSGDMSASYNVEVEIPSGYVWDKDAEFVKQNISITRGASPSRHPLNDGWWWEIIGEPWTNDTSVFIKVHIGAKSTWGQGGKITMQPSIRCLADPNAADPEYQKAYDSWTVELSDWQMKVSELTGEAMKNGQEKADLWERETLRQMDPIQELINAIISSHFPASSRDECWELELWQQLFDWDNASFRLFPSWWSDLPIRDSTKPPNDFINASFAKIYVPVKVGMETLALRWIFLQKLTPGKTPFENGLRTLQLQIEEFRKRYLGDVDETHITDVNGVQVAEEKFIPLAKWTELLPTDGTHLEVVQGATTALDVMSEGEAKALTDLRAAQLLSHKEDTELKRAAVAQITEPATVKISITTDRIDSQGPDELVR